MAFPVFSTHIVRSLRISASKPSDLETELAELGVVEGARGVRSKILGSVLGSEKISGKNCEVPNLREKVMLIGL